MPKVEMKNNWENWEKEQKKISYFKSTTNLIFNRSIKHGDITQMGGVFFWYLGGVFLQWSDDSQISVLWSYKNNLTIK